MQGCSSLLCLTVTLSVPLMLLRANSAAAAEESTPIYESNFKTPYSKNYRSEDGRGNYNFGYDIEDGLGNGQFRRESGNAAGERRGSYGFRAADGTYRVVNWVADHLGYRAAIVSNERGVVSSSPADVTYNGAPVKYSQDTEGASLPSSAEVPSQYQPTEGRPKGVPTPAVFAAPALGDLQ